MILVILLVLTGAMQSFLVKILTNLQKLMLPLGVDFFSQAVDIENFLEASANEPRNSRKRTRNRHSVRLRTYKAIISETMIQKICRQSESEIGNSVEMLSSSCMKPDKSSDEENAVGLFTDSCQKMWTPPYQKFFKDRGCRLRFQAVKNLYQVIFQAHIINPELLTNICQQLP